MFNLPKCPGPRGAIAREEYAASILEEAVAICRGLPTSDPEHPVQLHVRALLAADNGHDAVATACLRRLVSLAESNAQHWIDLGDVLMKQQCYPDAEAAYHRAIAIAPRTPDLLNRLGRALLCQDRVDEAKTCCEHALYLAPTQADTHGALADIAHAQGELSTAVAHAERSIWLDSGDAEAHERLGRLRLQQAEWELALASFQRVLQLNPKQTEALVGVGEAMLGLGRTEAALAAFRDALAFDPHHVTAARRLAETLVQSGRDADAVDARCQLGEALHRQGRLDDATSAYTEALAHKPDCLKALRSLVGLSIQHADPSAGIVHAAAALQVDPEHLPVHQMHGWALQLLGDIERGWEAMARFDAHTQRGRRYFEQPLWDGGPLDGRTILLWADEALGDTIQYVRYAQFAKARGASVILQCASRLVPLLARAAYVDRVVPRRAPLPAFDVQAPLSALPRLLGTTPATIPATVPYVAFDPELSAIWHTRLGPSDGKVTVGLVWGGEPDRLSARDRFTSLDTFAPLADVPDVRFIGLQQGLSAADLLAPPRGLRIEAFPEEARSLADTAALLAHLDLIITVDTMVAHLAGALGKPTWTLLAHVPDWRWGLEGRESRWYPTMRLFRQKRRGDWRGLMNEVREALDCYVVERCQMR